MTSRTHQPQQGMLPTYAAGVLLASLLTALVAVIAAGHAPPTYTSVATVLVESKSTRPGLGDPQMGNEKQVAESSRVANIAADRLGLHGPARTGLHGGLSVSVPVDTTVLRIAYTSTDSWEAYWRAYAFTDAYMNYRNSQETQQVARLLSAPRESHHGSGRSLVLLVAVGALAGAALGLFLAWAWDRLRGRFRSLADLEWHSGLAVIGRVPHLRDDLDLPWSGPRTRQAFSHLAVRVLTVLGNPRHGMVVLVTSPRAGAGTSTVAFELASSLAGLGRKVVVLDARPGPGGLGARLDHPGDPGLADVLGSGRSIDTVVVATPVPRLTLVPPGGATPGSAARGELDVDALRSALTRLATRAIVVVDGPPLLEDAGALVLADRADAVLLVADAARGTRKDARQAVLRIGGPGERSLGWVTNRPAHGRWRSMLPRRVARLLPPSPDEVRPRSVEAPVEPQRDGAVTGLSGDRG